MGRMIRKQVYIEEEQDALLKQRACALGVTESWLIRQGIDQALRTRVEPYRDRQAWQDALAFMRERQQLVGKVPPQEGRGWTREELYEERLAPFSR
jgi:hypothetical protein